MNSFKDLYPVFEHPKLKENDALLDELENHFNILGSDHFGEKFSSIVRDGFYPYYFSQKFKILFIGKEALGLDASNCLEEIADCYWNVNCDWNAKRIGEKHLNAHFFHARMLHISYGLLNGFCDWDGIPWATEIGDTFARPGGISSAFMNLSKVSNESGNWPADWNLIDKSLAVSSENGNLIKKQIDILEPDIIISMNILPQLKKILGDLVLFHQAGKADGYFVNVGGKKTLLIDAYHFSYVASHVDYFYAPICEIVRKWNVLEG